MFQVCVSELSLLNSAGSLTPDIRVKRRLSPVDSGLRDRSSCFRAVLPAVVVSVGTSQELCGSAASHVVLSLCADINAAASAGLHREFCSSGSELESSALVKLDLEIRKKHKDPAYF